MIEIDKQDFLYKHLTKLGVENENLDKLYLEYANAGVTNLKDFKGYTYSKYAETVGDELDDSFMEEMLPYYRDLKKVKAKRQDLRNLLIEYKETKNQELKDEIINLKLKDVLFQAYLYKLKYKDIEVMDIVQVCNIGLLQAIEKYEPKYRISIDDYIEFWINIEIENNFTKEKK